MNRLKFTAFFLLAILPLLSGCVFKDNVKKLVLAAKETAAKPIDYFKVIKVIDGDTIDIEYFGKTERIRMIGINTPESVDPKKPVECFGKEAATEGAKLLAGKFVSIERDKTQDDRDIYGRMLRYVRIKDGNFYNLEIIRSGFAFEYTYKVPYYYQKDFKNAQAEAQKNKRGLWADKACGAKINAKPAMNISAAATNGSCLIKGNISSNKKQKIYHLPSCPDYKKTVINPEAGEKFFCSESEAKKYGFRKALNCK